MTAAAAIGYGCGADPPPPSGPCPKIAGASVRPAATGPGSAGDQRFFARKAFWNTPLAADAALDPSSEAGVSALARMAAETGAGLSFRDYGVPVYTVGRDQPCVAVRLLNRNAQLRAVMTSVPVPPDAEPAAGTDGHIAIWQPSTDTYWELFKARRESDGWRAQYGGRIVGLSRNPGHFERVRGADGRVLEQPWWGATATGLPLVGGLITFGDLRHGQIDHALALAVPRVRRGVMALPAQRSDGKYAGAYSLPEGARFRLDPRVDVDALALSPVVRMIARAAQRYGMVIRDGGSRVAVYGQTAPGGASEPFVELLDGELPSEALSGFPWSRMQLGRMRLVADTR
jgi:hypothetical protein